MEEQFEPLRLFCPAEDWKWSEWINTPRELQLVKDIASRLGLKIRVDLVAKKVYLGSKQQAKIASEKVTDISARVRPIAQRNGISCGQTSVAMAVNTLKGTSLNDADINTRFGFDLLPALDSLTGGLYEDEGNLAPGSHLWEGAIRKSLGKKAGVLIGLSGEFSPSGRGHIVLITGLLGPDRVKYADPATGTFKVTTRSAMENCAAHPDGKFVFAAR